MRCRIHRGADEIGGNCIELEAQGARLVLDLGQPLTSRNGTAAELPAVHGLVDRDPSLLGIVLTHPHPDHYGLVSMVSSSVPVYIGEAATRILEQAAFFTPSGLSLSPTGFLWHRQTLRVGPFQITPFLNDHSAFDAYSLLIEADSRRLFYTGDIRAHGRKAALFDELVARPPENIDVLLMEGTQVRTDSTGAERGPSESDVEAACVATCSSTTGMVLGMFSPQNIDRLVTFYRAALRSGRDLVIDLYTAAVAAATGLATIPQAHWKRVRVYLPRAQRTKVVAAGAFARTAAVKDRRIYEDELVARRSELVMMFRMSMAREFVAMRCLDGATAVWSMWPGYLREPSGLALERFLHQLGIPLVTHHASGHAFIPDLRGSSDLRVARIEG